MSLTNTSPNSYKKCKIAECDKPSRARDMCKVHFTREYRKQPHIKERRKQEYLKNKESLNASNKKNYHEKYKNDVRFIEYRKVYSEKWRSENKELHKKLICDWKLKNSDKLAAKEAKRRFLKRTACPNWLTDTQLEEMNKIYKEAKEKNMEVDHIIPLNNENVVGLHVPWNLQLLTKKENITKSNKFDGTHNNESWRSA